MFRKEIRVYSYKEKREIQAKTELYTSKSEGNWNTITMTNNLLHEYNMFASSKNIDFIAKTQDSGWKRVL